VKQAMPPFMSTAPRPQTMPSRIAPEKGGTRQALSSPGGTTSVCPAKARHGRPSPIAA
jgi:hypothetical protein